MGLVDTLQNIKMISLIHAHTVMQKRTIFHVDQYIAFSQYIYTT